MSIKTLLQKILPSFRARDAIRADLKEYYDKLNTRLDLMDMKNEYLFFCIQHLDGETDLETKKRVFLNMPKASGKLAELQKGANYILSRVKKICDENGISFALCGGTLMGAVRHHGFIPWDDDIDIDILRDDYYRLEELLQNDEELTMQRYYKFMEGKAGYSAKIKLKGSDQFFIDVFPMDYITVEPGQEERIEKEKEVLCDEFSDKVKEVYDRHRLYNDGNPKAVAKPEMDSEIISLEKEYVQRYKDQFIKDNRHTHVTRGIGNCKWLRDIYNLQKYEDCLPYQKDALFFEGKQYDTFNHYDHLLRYEYGDYWSLPKSIVPLHLTREYQEFSEADEELIKRLMEKDEGRTE